MIVSHRFPWFLQYLCFQGQWICGWFPTKLSKLAWYAGQQVSLKIQILWKSILHSTQSSLGSSEYPLNRKLIWIFEVTWTCQLSRNVSNGFVDLGNKYCSTFKIYNRHYLLNRKLTCVRAPTELPMKVLQRQLARLHQSGHDNTPCHLVNIADLIGLMKRNSLKIHNTYKFRL